MNTQQIKDEIRELSWIEKIKLYRSIDDEAAIELLARIEAPGSSAIRYRIVVGGIGVVYEGESGPEADQRFEMFEARSKISGSASAKRVRLFKNYEMVREYYPS